MDIGSLSDKELKELQCLIETELERRKVAGIWEIKQDDDGDFLSLTYQLGGHHKIVFGITDDKEIMWAHYSEDGLPETGFIHSVEDMMAIEAFAECPIDKKTYTRQFEKLRLETLDLFG